MMTEWPYLWIDATYVKVRQNGRIVSVAVIVAVGVNSDGRREVLGMDIGPSEAETFWTEFLRKLARRGLRGVRLVVSDAHEGIKASVAKVLTATWQRCRVGLLKKPVFEEVYPDASGVCHMPTANERCCAAVDLRRPIKSSSAARTAVASRLRFTAAAVRKAWMRIFWSPRLTARASPC